MERFNKDNFYTLCNELAQRDGDLEVIIKEHGYPPLWTRPNTFATLVLTILEQQVSLQSAFAAFTKLSQKLNIITPEGVLQLTDDELRACYFSRQKIVYVKGLATEISKKQIDLDAFYHLPDDEVRKKLVSLKGIGNWTVDIYLMHALQRTDVYPTGDLALVKALREIKRLPLTTTKEEMAAIGVKWKPYRSIATMILWHYYLSKRGIKLVH
ncbi:MAG TPA: hypothetical protein VM888_07520 [Chitinophagaceae bacterium]|nr:hypothetical protein [Chitinophagaceae bacterium]